MLKTHESTFSDAKNNPKSKTNTTNNFEWISHSFLSQTLINFGSKSVRKVIRWSCARSSRSVDPRTGGEGPWEGALGGEGTLG